MLAMSKTHCIPSRITYSIPTSLAVLLEVYRITVQVIQYGLVFSAYAYLEKSSIGDTYNLPCTVSIQDKLCGALCISKSRLNSHNG